MLTVKQLRQNLSVSAIFLLSVLWRSDGKLNKEELINKYFIKTRLILIN